MNKITYMFGAGASVGALPIVKDIPDRLHKLIDKISNPDMKLSDETIDYPAIKAPKKFCEYQKELIESLSWLKDNTDLHTSIDTYAKKLWIKKQNEELRKLKITLSIFFVLEQLTNRPDKRYDSFYASIITSLYKFPEHIKILSWNYDYQFELSYTSYSEKPTIQQNQEILNIHSKNWYRDFFDNTGFAVYKLNGTTGFTALKSDDSYNYMNEYKGYLDKNMLQEVVNNYAISTYTDFIVPTLSFAWENEIKEVKILKNAMIDTKDTRVLVVIGYSFPFFNRDVDRLILKNMKDLKKIYIQDPNADNIKERIDATLGYGGYYKTICIKNTEQFYLPDEL